MPRRKRSSKRRGLTLQEVLLLRHGRRTDLERYVGSLANALLFYGDHLEEVRDGEPGTFRSACWWFRHRADGAPEAEAERLSFLAQGGHLSPTERLDALHRAQDVLGFAPSKDEQARWRALRKVLR